MLKYLIISNSKNIKYLSFAHDEVSVIENFMRGCVKTEMMFINTNLGLEIYYFSPFNLKKLIISSLELITSHRNINVRTYQISSFTKSEDIIAHICKNHNRMYRMPFSYKCYIQSLFRQLELNKTKNRKIIKKLIDIWYKIMSSPNFNKKIRLNFIKPLNKFLKLNPTVANKIAIRKHLVQNEMSSFKRN